MKSFFDADLTLFRTHSNKHEMDSQNPCGVSAFIGFSVAIEHPDCFTVYRSERRRQSYKCVITCFDLIGGSSAGRLRFANRWGSPAKTCRPFNSGTEAHTSIGHLVFMPRLPRASYRPQIPSNPETSHRCILIFTKYVHKVCISLQ